LPSEIFPVRIECPDLDNPELHISSAESLGVAKSRERIHLEAQRDCGYYNRMLVTRVGHIELRVPQDRQGRFRTDIFEGRQVAGIGEATHVKSDLSQDYSRRGEFHARNIAQFSDQTSSGVKYWTLNPDKSAPERLQVCCYR